MLTDVCWDIKVFLFILLLVELGFSEAFLRISETSEKGVWMANYADTLAYTFYLSLGNIILEGYDETIQPVTVYILMVIFVVIASILMLNLLIAVMVSSYRRINENAISNRY
jgi:hypothetical protein